MFPLVYHFHQLFSRRGDERRESVWRRARHVLDHVQRSKHRRHLGQLEVEHIHVDMKLCHHCERRLLLVELDKESAEDSLADDTFTALQVQSVGYKVSEIKVPYLRILLLSFDEVS